jgi:hypothetical protein
LQSLCQPLASARGSLGVRKSFDRTTIRGLKPAAVKENISSGNLFTDLLLVDAW